MSSGDGRELTTTSYAILGLLAIRPWSTYELAKQMRRSLHHIWPRAESNVYAEPKRLVSAGLVSADVEMNGKRSRTLYTITAQGRLTLERWFSSENGPSRFESEALVKILFANYGTKASLLANLRSFMEDAAAVKALWKLVAEEYERGEQLFPERLHINALIFRWVWEQTELKMRWADWAIEWVESWPDASGPEDSEASFEVFRMVLHSA
jgi:DNA-binding PadR family transcriptional regulator